MEHDLLYSYSAKPRPVQTNRGKTFDGDKPIRPINIMQDPRIPRGSVFAPINASRFDTKREKVKKRKSKLKKKSKNNGNQASVFETRMGTTKAFTSISLDANLIEKPQSAMKYDSISQTDEFLPRTVITPIDQFLQRRDDVDISTQIEESDGLFNFDNEVKPLLNVMVNKILEQALQEVEEEQEMQMLHCEHNILKAAMNDAKHLERELEEKAKEAARRKERTKKEKAEQMARDVKMREKLFAWQLARPLVRKVMDQTTHTLQQKGLFYDPALRNLSRWLMKDVCKNVNNFIDLRDLSMELVDDLLFYGLHRRAVIAHSPSKFC